MSKIIELKFVRPVKVKDAVYKGRKIKISEINRDGGEFGVERKKGKRKSKHKGLDFLSKEVGVFVSTQKE